MATTKIDDLCKCFKELIRIQAVNVYSEHKGKVGFMFHIPNTNFRYNTCPCCGVNVRDIEVDIKEFRSLIR